ncbi:MAG: TIGR02677 family protein [Clostridiales bacterium]|nr:TIGR02677 family protein [Clostridiales bacterium]MDD6390245.1 TIGR02677 family protein [Bacillota bacterium]MDY5975723.1 TIGR02677 family protein [Anaerovoracaceae bacterium]
MQLSDKLIRPVTETKYLNADNVSRYRCIMRIFFENYEKFKYWLYQEEVYEEMIRNPLFSDYRPQQCQQDLEMLTEWKNLHTIQDTRKVASIEEFKNRKYRYQMSEYSVEIERLVIRLEDMYIEGSSLEPTLLERIRRSIESVSEIADRDSEEVYTWWTYLNNDFVRLNQNYQDYIRDLNSIRAEEMMRTREFLVFKDRLIEYLRSFIKGLQRNIGVIEEQLRLFDEDAKEKIFRKVTDYELSIPRMDAEVSEEMIEQKITGRFQSIYDWFAGREGQDSEAAKLFDVTNDIIRRITRYAAQLSEKNALGANRKEEYRKVAELFLRCKDTEEAHKMSAMVFGLERPQHLAGDPVRETDSMNTGVYEEKPLEIVLKPRVRTYRERSYRSAIRESAEQKQETRRMMIIRQKEEAEKLKGLERDGRIDFSELPVLEPRLREILLKWISDALESADYSARTDDGRKFVLETGLGEEKCVVRCEDGNFTMPKMTIVFQEEEL